MHAWWTGPYKGHPARWQGRNQVENKSEENIRACYRWLRALPYQGKEDRTRLTELENVSVAEQKMTDG